MEACSRKNVAVIYQSHNALGATDIIYSTSHIKKDKLQRINYVGFFSVLFHVIGAVNATHNAPPTQ